LTDGLEPQAIETALDVLTHLKQNLTMESAGPTLAVAGE